jgi:LmbE family N-acetylglucosaminyl deacetylase
MEFPPRLTYNRVVMEERQWAPYEAGKFDGSRFLLLAAHPDDEVLGAGGTLHLLAARGAEVQVVIFSRGEAWGDGEVRAAESRKAAETLGHPEPVFLDFPDRGFRERLSQVEKRIADLLKDGPWDVVFCPAPTEIHPDHRALSYALLTLIQSSSIGEPLLQSVWNTRIAFYEVSAPQRVDFLSDITSAVDKKRGAIEAFASQNAKHDFLSKILGLNAYRSYTLPPTVTHAEGFRVTGWQNVRTAPITAWFPAEDPLLAAGVRASIGVVVRTRNRPHLLREALESLAASSLAPEQVMVVNNGDEPVDGVLADFPALKPMLLSTGGKGRSAAANLGLKALTTEYAAFLDDDDLVYPHHYAVLARALKAGGAGVVYGDAVSAVYHVHPSTGARELKDKVIAYSRDFDADLLLYDNYIPFHTLLFRRELALAAGPLREDLEVFEDWEFLIRLSGLAPFLHLRQATCEYRHFSTAQTLGEDPARKADFHRNRRRILDLTRPLRTPDVEERLFKALNDEGRRLTAELAVLGGEAQFLRHKSEETHREIGRLGRELEIAQGASRTLAGEKDALEERLAQTEARLAVEVRARKDDVDKLAGENQDLARHLEVAYGEIHRLNQTLSLIYVSKTWKVHSWIQKLKRFYRT